MYKRQGQLCGLEVGEAQGGQGLVSVGEFGQVVQHPHQLIPHQHETFPHDDDIGVVPHVAAGSAQVDDGHGVGTLVAVGVDVSHDVMAQLLFVSGGGFVVDVVHVLLQLGHLRLGHRQTQLHLRPCQGNPEPVSYTHLDVYKRQPDGWRHYGQLFLWPAEAGDGGLTKKTGEHGCPPVLRF